MYMGHEFYDHCTCTVPALYLSWHPCARPSQHRLQKQTCYYLLNKSGVFAEQTRIHKISCHHFSNGRPQLGIHSSRCTEHYQMSVPHIYITQITFSADGQAHSYNGMTETFQSLQWRHNGLDGFSNHQPHHCLLSRLFGRRSKKTSKLHVTALCAGNSPVTGEFPAQRASYAENVSISWRHHGDPHKEASQKGHKRSLINGSASPYIF